MAVVSKPNRKGTPPKMDDASSILTNLPARKSGIRKDLNFKVDADFKKRFKTYATVNDLSMHDLLIKAFEYYELGHK